jgi:hypothetical protein
MQKIKIISIQDQTQHPTLQAHNLILSGTGPDKQVSQLSCKHKKGKTFKAYISETKGHWMTAQDR